MAHFELLEGKLIGEGSFGKVYQCLWHGCLAAAKQFNVTQNEETDEITKEIQMIKELRNDNIIQFFGTERHQGKLCLITSYAERGTLRQALARHTLLEEQKPRIILGLIKGMLYLKSNNVVHRDFKSPNVLLDFHFTPKICDFGLAVLKLNSSTHIKVSSTVGTTRWMAPELLRIRPRYSFASDVYALGIVIWEVLTERLPYAEHINNENIRYLIKDGDHEEIPDHIPEHYRAIIKKCWHFEPEDRISVEEISRTIDATHHTVNNQLPNAVYTDEIAASVIKIRLDSEHTSIKQRSLSRSPSPAPDTATKPLSTGYAIVSHQYLQDSSNVLDAKDHLKSILNAHGNGFTQWIKAMAGQANDDATIILGEMHFYGFGVPQNYQAAAEQFSMLVVDRNLKLSISRGAKISREAVKRRKIRAYFNMGLMYEEGRGIPLNDEKAVKLYTKAAEQGDASAQNRLGLMYQYARGVPRNYQKAVELFEKAANHGHSYAQVNLACMYESGFGVPKRVDKAFEWNTKAATQNNAYAQYNLGLMYRNGRHVAKNYNEAVKWFTKASENGFKDAQYCLGWMYANGQGVPRSYENALEWYTKAAEQGHEYAQCSLGEMYAFGRGVPQSYEKAVKWFVKAAENGYEAAQNNLGWMYKNGRGVPQSDSKAVEWYAKAAKQGNAVAQYNLGWMYQNGQGVPQNFEKAAEWYTRAAALGNAGAQYSLGWMYRNGQGVPQSDQKSVEWYTKAADQGNANAQNNLGRMYFNGRGVQQSYEKAAEWYMKAADQGHADAQYNLGWMYWNGQGVPQSDYMAAQLFTKAAEQGNTNAQYSLNQIYGSGPSTPRIDISPVDAYPNVSLQDAYTQNNMAWMYNISRSASPSYDNVRWYQETAGQSNGMPPKLFQNLSSRTSS